ncbi:MAG: hypothetical protein ACI30W_03985, partial [Muribaculaceae bacterium]
MAADRGLRSSPTTLPPANAQQRKRCRGDGFQPEDTGDYPAKHQRQKHIKFAVWGYNVIDIYNAAM